MATINVTQRDINRGLRRSTSLCPIALAAQRILKKNVSVGWEILKEIDNDGIVRKNYRLSEKAQAFIDAFDNNLHVVPFKFVVK